MTKLEKQNLKYASNPEFWEQCKQYRREYYRAMKAEYPESLLEYQRAYRLKNIDKIRAQSRARYLKQKEKKTDEMPE